MFFTGVNLKFDNVQHKLLLILFNVFFLYSYLYYCICVFIGFKVLLFYHTSNLFFLYYLTFFLYKALWVAALHEKYHVNKVWLIWYYTISTWKGHSTVRVNSPQYSVHLLVACGCWQIGWQDIHRETKLSQYRPAGQRPPISPMTLTLTDNTGNSIYAH